MARTAAGLLKTWAIVTLLPAAAWAQNVTTARREASPPKLTERPKLDGRLDDPCWQKAAKLARFTQRGRPTQSETRAMIFHDDVNLYVGVHCEEPLIGKMRSKHTLRDGPIWEDDCVELFIDANLNRKSYFHFIANSVDGRADGFHDGSGQTRKGMLFDIEWTSKAYVGKGFWSVEFVVPWQTLNLPDRPSHDMGFTICRERYPVNEYPTWQGWFHRPRTWGALKGVRLSRAGNPIRYDALDFGEGLWGENLFSADLVNLGPDARYTLDLSLVAEGRVKNTRQAPVHLPKGRPQRVTGRYWIEPGARPKGRFRLTAALKPADGRGALLPLLGKQFRVLSKTVAQLSMADAGICYADQAEARLTVRCFLSQATVKRGLLLSVSVRNDAGKEVHARRNLPFDAQAYAHAIPVARLAQGWYRVRATVSRRGAQGALAAADLTLRKVAGPFDAQPTARP